MWCNSIIQKKSSKCVVGREKLCVYLQLQLQQQTTNRKNVLNTRVKFPHSLTIYNLKLELIHIYFIGRNYNNNNNNNASLLFIKQLKFKLFVYNICFVVFCCFFLYLNMHFLLLFKIKTEWSFKEESTRG